MVHKVFQLSVRVSRAAFGDGRSGNLGRGLPELAAGSWGKKAVEGGGLVGEDPNPKLKTPVRQHTLQKTGPTT